MSSDGSGSLQLQVVGFSGSQMDADYWKANSMISWHPFIEDCGVVSKKKKKSFDRRKKGRHVCEAKWKNKRV